MKSVPWNVTSVSMCIVELLIMAMAMHETKGP